MESLDLAKTIVKEASAVKAIDIKILDLRGLTSFTDFFVICSGTSDRQLRAIGDRVIEELKKEGLTPLSKEGYEQGQWVLIDYPGVVLHVFTEEARAHYDLEGFWEKAKRPRVSKSATTSRKTSVKAKKAKPKSSAKARLA